MTSFQDAPDEAIEADEAKEPCSGRAKNSRAKKKLLCLWYLYNCTSYNNLFVFDYLEI